MKIRNAAKIILAVLAVLGLLALYNHSKDLKREAYAEQNNCTWVVQGAHDICK